MKAAKPRPTKPRISAMSFSSVYPLYIKKAEAKGRTKAEVDQDELARGRPMDKILRA